MALSRNLLDDTESRRAITQSQPSSGSTLLEIEIADTVDVSDAGEWIRTWLAPFGGFVTFRQGSIVVRVLQDPVKVGGRTVLDLDGDSDFFELSGDLDNTEYDAAYTEVVHHAQGVRQSSEFVEFDVAGQRETRDLTSLDRQGLIEFLRLQVVRPGMLLNNRAPDGIPGFEHAHRGPNLVGDLISDT
jgi:hypothetical protein